MGWLRALAFVLFLVPAGASPLVTGNGHGFAVVDPASGDVVKLYAHPYSFTRPDPRKPLSEGVPTANFVKRIHWTGAHGRPNYIGESQVIAIGPPYPSVSVFMPFGLDRNVLVLEAFGDGDWQATWSALVTDRSALDGEAQLLAFEGVEEKLLLVPLVPRQSRTDDLSGAKVWALVVVEDSAGASAAAEAVRAWYHGAATIGSEIKELENWRAAPPPLRSEKEASLWRQSETLLRIAQSREPNRPGRYSNGLIVAALPDGSWFMPWVRDMAWGALALSRMGHKAEARAALLAYFNARPSGLMAAQTHGDYQISVARYFGNGAEEPFFTQEGATNIELDDWGEVLWLLGDYIARSGDASVLREPTARGPLYESARDYVLNPLLANLEPYGGGLIAAADTSIWEERQKDKKHFAFTTAAAIKGLQAFAAVAAKAGDAPTEALIAAKLALLEKGFAAAFIRDGLLRGALEQGIKNDVDGALLAVITMGVITDPVLIASTAARMDLLKVASGGWKRVRSTYTDPKIYEYWYERQEFAFVDLQMAEVLRRLGRTADADAILARIVAKSATDHYFVPEMYVAEDCPLFHGEIGAPTGAIPMVGYGAGAFVLNVLAREGK